MRGGGEESLAKKDCVDEESIRRRVCLVGWRIDKTILMSFDLVCSACYHLAEL